MKKNIVFFLIFLLLSSSIEAGKSYSGKSFSSGRSSSFSGRSSSFRPSSSSFKPSSSSFRSSSKPSSSSFKPSSSSSKSYSSKPSSKSYSNSSSKSVPSSPIHSNSDSYKPSYKPSGSSIFDGFSSAAKTEQSKIKFNQVNAPKPSYTSPAGKVKEFNPNSSSANIVRKHTTPERSSTYQQRSTVFYSPYSATPTHYNDSFSPFLWGWLFSSSLNSHDRATWMYHHQSEMDEQRYKDMLAKDAQLQKEIEELKRNNVAVNPEYVPEKLKDNPDIMYNKEFVEASTTTPEVFQSTTQRQQDEQSYVGLYVMGMFFFCVFVWFLFFKEFN
ncbi:MAG: hypothetical protein EKK64_00350 [Neisseriaceae bacterium]|nr:MAG: hypothetical protein EKK64_00350 [Neisseriaceae bacterium]